MSLLLQIALSFMKIGALSFGGGYASVPLVEREVVEIQGWMSYAEFANLMALDEVTSGPIIINCATFVGMRVAGLAGAVTATIACIIVPCLVSLALVFAYRRFKDMTAMREVIGALKCMASGLIISTLLRFLQNLVFPAGSLRGGVDMAALCIIAIAFYLIRRRNFNSLLMLVCCGAASLALSLVTSI